MWVTSDTHFNHAMAIKYMDRPFKDVEEMNETIINNWNLVVGPRQTVYHLGDFGFHQKGDATEINEIVNRLNGKIILIHGNHDDFLLDFDCWEESVPLKYIRFNKWKFFLSHYAMRTWRGSHRGTINLYGHSHGDLPDTGLRQMDVGVDCNNFIPLRLEEVIEKLRDRNFIGHHDFGSQAQEKRRLAQESS